MLSKGAPLAAHFLWARAEQIPAVLDKGELRKTSSGRQEPRLMTTNSTILEAINRKDFGWLCQQSMGTSKR